MKRALVLIAVGVPSLAWACSGCTDALVRKSAWWTAVPLLIAGPFLLDWILFQIYARERLPDRTPLRIGRLVVFAAGLLALVAFGLGALLSAAVLVAVLAWQLPRTFLQVRRSDRPERRVVEGVRMAILVGGLAFAVASALPPTLSTGKLISLAVAGPRVTLDEPTARDWIEEELTRRGDAVAQLERRLEGERRGRGASEAPSIFEKRFARLHHLAGGDPAGRQATCAATAASRSPRALGPMCPKAMGDRQLAR